MKKKILTNNWKKHNYPRGADKKDNNLQHNNILV